MALILVLCMLALQLSGIALLASLRFLGRNTSSQDDIPLRRLIRLVGMLLLFAGIAGPLLSVLFFGGPFVWVATAVVLAAALERAYRARQYSLMGLLAVAAERHIPLMPAMEAFADEQGGRVARRIRQLLARLEDGWPLDVALRKSRGVVPPDAVPAVATGCESGRLGESLRRAVAIRNIDGPLRDAMAAKLLYLLFLFTMAASIITFMMLKIVPAFGKIFDDFGTELPALTRWSIDFASQFYLWAPLAQAFFAVVFGYAVLCYCGVRLPRLPGTNWLWRRRDSGMVLDGLALAAETDRPLIDALATLAGCFPAWNVRQRLAAVVDDMHEGRDWLDSLRAHRLLGRAELGVLRAAERVGNLPWALAEVADSCRRRHAYRIHLLMQVLFPIVIVAIGLVVMTIVVGYFIPLISLIERLTPSESWSAYSGS